MGKVKFDKLLNKPVLHIHDPLYLKDSGGNEWQLTVDTDGRVVTTRTGAVGEGSPFGPWLWLTYPEV